MRGYGVSACLGRKDRVGMSVGISKLKACALIVNLGGKGERYRVSGEWLKGYLSRQKPEFSCFLAACVGQHVTASFEAHLGYVFLHIAGKLLTRENVSAVNTHFDFVKVGVVDVAEKRELCITPVAAFALKNCLSVNSDLLYRVRGKGYRRAAAYNPCLVLGIREEFYQLIVHLKYLLRGIEAHRRTR